jgi:hypothetical protein
LYTAGEPSVPVVVPQVDLNILSPQDPSQVLSFFGQAARVAAWGSRIVIGDFVIDVLPFYGEQPTRHAPGAPEPLRNWGNCYRVTCPEYSIVILVDSGIDPAGSMIEVLRRSRIEHGAVDFVVSCCGFFPEAINPGLPMYAFALPMQRLEHVLLDRRRGRSTGMTLGPDGIAEACHAIEARYFLPYAHGYSGLCVSPTSEEAVAQSVASEIALRGRRTTVREWRPGDSAHFEDGQLVVVDGIG